MNIPAGSATGIGSLPFRDASAAVDLVLGCVRQVPFWPQLPRRDPREGMLAQFIEGLPCLGMRGGDVVYEPQDRDARLELFYEQIIARDTAPFAVSPDFARGLHAFHRRLKEDSAALARAELIKCHIIGPCTFAAGVKDGAGVALMHDEVMYQAIVAGLTMKALWQLRFFGEFGKKLLVFIDEPFLSAFGSAYTPLGRESVVAILRELTAAIRGAGALTGVHCCGNTDWSIFTDVSGLDVINFDAYGFFDKVALYARQLQGFLERGGYLCWGIVPTQGGAESPDELAAKVVSGIAELGRKGVDPRLLCERLLISPSCGLGSLEEDGATKIIRTLESTSAALRKGASASI